MADYWAKIYIEIIDDPKMATMPDRLWRRTIELFLLAKKFNREGHLPETRQLAWLLRMPIQELESDLQQIAQAGIIRPEEGGWFVVNFEKRQGASSSTERSQQYRQRTQKSQYYNADATVPQRNVAQRTETETETEAEAEGHDNDPSPLPEEQPAGIYRGYEQAFIAATKLPILAGGPEKWYLSFRAMQDAGVLPEDIPKAVSELAAKHYTITGPASVKNAAINIAIRRRNSHAPPDEPVYAEEYG